MAKRGYLLNFNTDEELKLFKDFQLESIELSFDKKKSVSIHDLIIRSMKLYKNKFIKK